MAAADTTIPPGAAATQAGDFEVVVIDELNVDHAYQRDLDPALVQKIADKWDMAASGPIVVSQRADDSLWIVNGQHRAAAAKLAGETEILAQVVHGYDRESEAELRLRGNTRRSDKSLERFKAQVAAGHKESLEIVRICREFDTRINQWPDQRSGINCVATIEWLYRRDQGVVLVRVFELVRDIYGDVGGDPAKSAVFKGLAWFITRHVNEFDRPRLVEQLSKQGQKGLHQRAVAHKAAMGGAMWTNYYRSMVEVYNDKLSPARRLEWQTGGWGRAERLPQQSSNGEGTAE